jgi:hypothetical protein
LTAYTDGNQNGNPTTIGQIAFASNLDLVSIGTSEGFVNYKSTASVEFYLRPLSKAEIILAMNKSYTLAFNPKCNV